MTLGTLKPRLGMRMWSGIWPPSKPLMATPERAVWPLPPRPPVLPLPEPMPRPTRMRVLFGAGIVAEFVETGHCVSPLPYFSPTTRTRCGQLVDHAAHFGSVLEGALLADLVEPEPDQGRALVGLAADAGSRSARR